MWNLSLSKFDRLRIIPISRWWQRRIQQDISINSSRSRLYSRLRAMRSRKILLIHWNSPLSQRNNGGMDKCRSREVNAEQAPNRSTTVWNQMEPVTWDHIKIIHADWSRLYSLDLGNDKQKEKCGSIGLPFAVLPLYLAAEEPAPMGEWFKVPGLFSSSQKGCRCTPWFCICEARLGCNVADSGTVCSKSPSVLIFHRDH